MENRGGMTPKQALITLRMYNRWRRDDSVPPKFCMPDPVEVGKAIDVAIEALKSKA